MVLVTEVSILGQISLCVCRLCNSPEAGDLFLNSHECNSYIESMYTIYEKPYFQAYL